MTAKKLPSKGVSLTHVKGERFVDESGYYDAMEVMQQSGLVPEMAA